MKLKGTVTRLADFGAFIDIGAEREGLVHVSEMSNEYVSSPKDIVSMGDSVEVNVLEIDRKRRQIRLSMKSTEFEYEEEEEQPEEQVPTAMELALREALEDTDEGKPVQPAASERPGKKDRRELEDILSRTLEHRVRTGTSEE
jgi:ribosomal protein S1